MRSVICLLILMLGVHCSDTGIGMADMGMGGKDLSMAPEDLGAAPEDLGTAPADLGTAPADLGVPVQQKLCRTDGWCWENPLPQGNSLQGMWAADANNIWAVGLGGMIV